MAGITLRKYSQELFSVILVYPVVIWKHTIWKKLLGIMSFSMILKPFVSNVPFLYPLKTSRNLTVFWCFQGVQKACIGNKRVNAFLTIYGIVPGDFYKLCTYGKKCVSVHVTNVANLIYIIQRKWHPKNEENTQKIIAFRCILVF